MVGRSLAFLNDKTLYVLYGHAIKSLTTNDLETSVPRSEHNRLQVKDASSVAAGAEASGGQKTSSTPDVTCTSTANSMFTSNLSRCHPDPTNR